MAAVPVALHVGIEEVPWVENPRVPGARMRLLQVDADAQMSVTHGFLPAGLGAVQYVSSWALTLADYYEGCERAGLSRPKGILR